MADDYIETRPDVQRGEPVIRGTRITVYTIAALVERGTPVDEILRHYPSLTAEQVEAAHRYAQAQPRVPPLIGHRGSIVFEISAKDLGEKS